MAVPYDALQIAGIVILSTVFTEVVMYLWAYRHSSFRSLKVTLELQAKKLEVIKSAPAAGGKASKAKEKKAERLESAMKRDAVRELGAVRFKQGLVMVAAMFVTFRVLDAWYSGKVVAELPFEPFALLRRATQRTLETPKKTDCGLTFIFMLGQMSLRPNISKLLDWGLTRRMQELQAWQPPEPTQA